MSEEQSQQEANPGGSGRKGRPPRDPEARMTFTAHLAELRNRLIFSGLALAVAFLLSYFAWKPIFGFLRGAIEQHLKDEMVWKTLTPFEGIFARIRVALWGGLVIALPFIAYQICAFIFPGLRPKEKRAAQILIFGCGTLFVLGVLTAYFAIFPFVLPYLMQMNPAGVESELRLQETLQLIIKGFVAFGIAFQFPMVVLVLVYLELLTPQALRSYRRMVYVILAVASATLTPPDPFTMLTMWLPMVLLYELSILVSYVVVRRKNKSA